MADEVIFKKAGLSAVRVSHEHYPALFEMIRSYDSYCLTYNIPGDLEVFSRWMDKSMQAGVTGVYKGHAVALIYFSDLYDGFYGNVHIFKHRTFYHPMLHTLALNALRQMMDDFNLEKVQGITSVHAVSLQRYFKMLGFNNDGLLRHHAKVKGVWTDFSVWSRLRSEFEDIPQSSDPHADGRDPE